MSRVFMHPYQALANLGTKSSRLNDYTLDQKRAQQVITTVISIPSVLFSLSTLFYLFRVRRNFRHTLIILLLISQSFKVLFFAIYACYKLSLRHPTAYELASSHTISGSSAFCLADGFLLTHATSSADFTVLLIALHTLLTIIRPRNHIDEGGLFPHRHFIYTLWLFYPIFIASLAFINGTSAFLDQGSFCTLPVRPFWFRLALQWVPRYLILSMIMIMYVSIYFYVVFKFKRLDEIHASVTSMSGTEWSGPGSVRSAQTNHALNLKQRHRAIKRQLRYMFIYPLVYATLWIVPFIAHCYGYTAHALPFVLSTAAIVSNTFQCAGDCIVVWLREKPWQRDKDRVQQSRAAVRQREILRRESMGRKPSIFAGWGSLSSGGVISIREEEVRRVIGQEAGARNGSDRSLVRAFSRFRLGDSTANGRDGTRTRHWWDADADVFASRDRVHVSGLADSNATVTPAEVEKQTVNG